MTANALDSIHARSIARANGELPRVDNESVPCSVKVICDDGKDIELRSGLEFAILPMGRFSDSGARSGRNYSKSGNSADWALGPMYLRFDFFSLTRIQEGQVQDSWRRCSGASTIRRIAQPKWSRLRGVAGKFQSQTP